jgi:uncharacterized protein
MAESDDRDREERPVRGFAALTPEMRRALGSRGGKLAQERGTANRFNSDTASAAGRIPHEKGTAHHFTSEQARAAGRKGGKAPRRRRRADGSLVTDATPTVAADGEKEGSPQT